MLGIITGGLIILGCLALYVAGEESLYGAFWLAVAGAGIDWTFSERAQDPDWGALLLRVLWDTGGPVGLAPAPGSRAQSATTAGGWSSRATSRPSSSHRGCSA